MVNYNKFSLCYKSELDKIERSLKKEEKEIYTQLFEYDENHFINVVGEKSKREIESEIQKVDVDSKKNEIEIYKMNELYNYIRKRIYEYLNWIDFNSTGSGKEKLYCIILSISLDNNIKEYPVVLQKFINGSGNSIKKNIKNFQYITEVLQSDFENGEYKEKDIKEMYSAFWDKLKKYKEKEIWMMRKCVHEIPSKYSYLIYGSDYDGIELLERDSCNRLVKFWIQFAEKECKKSKVRKKEILLCKAKDIKNLKIRFLKETKGKIKNWRISKVIDYYYDFLCENIFPNISFWKMVLDNQMIEKRYYDNKLNERIREKIYVDGDFIWTNEYRKEIEKQILMAASEEELAYEIDWSCPPDGIDLFKYNFDRYSFRRCFGVLYAIYFGGEIGAKNLLELYSYSETNYEKSVDVKKEIHNIFLKWVSLRHIENFYASILKEVLFCIFDGTTLPKNECKKVGYDKINGYSLIGEEDKIETQIWSMFESKKDTIKLNKYFSPEYQLKDFRKGTKIKQPKFLIDREWTLYNEVEYFESYMLEMQSGVFTAWKLYSVIYELANFKKESKELLEVIFRIAENVGNIHNLELRIFVVNALKGVFHAVMNNQYISMLDSLNQIAEMVEEEAKVFNERYDKVVLTLLWIYKDEERWKNIIWLRNMENEQFSNLLKEIKYLRKTVNGDESYYQMKFLSIYKEQKKAKGREYTIYNGIINRLKRECNSGKPWIYEWK